MKEHKTISFYTLGCRLNQSETSVIEHAFRIDGYDIVDFDIPADMVVINTCTVTEGGDAETRRLIQKAARLNPETRIALIGCQAQVQKEKISDHPNVRWIIGNAAKMDLKNLIRTMGEGDRHVYAPAIPRAEFTHPLGAVDRRHKRANLKIQDGCDFFCSFCEIPYARGRARSRVFSDIVADAHALTSAGHREIVLTGINIGTYAQGGNSILDVIDALEQIDRLDRIRISSIEPTTIPAGLLKRMIQSKKLCRHLHVPLQSASDRILTLMKRKYAYGEFLEFIQSAATQVPGICIGTDVIVGFNGESEDDFQQSVERIKEAPLHYLHVFSYSQRQLAQSRRLDGRIPAAEIKRRSGVLRQLSERKQALYRQTMVGRRVPVLWESLEADDRWSGLTENYVRVFTRSREHLANRILPVLLKHLSGHGVFGELV